ncbi:membrane protein YfhO [Saccharicrinis carchari]|uniref:Membrane protein YfhO n=1 Tax=Saccharicrinis carchari TaxID=1168039 RepID=A0A521EGA3_SACCC|nr:YfhO family protein [Saccharicrinis carchari]SMO82945.1 membrane protein YfhO [Saccharicrinis carchari]
MIDKIKSSLPYIGTVLLFVVLSFAYFSPVLKNKTLLQMDNSHAIGMAQELESFEKETGETSQWTNSAFSGMPAYQIKGDSSKNIFSYINRVMRLALPYHTVAILFLYLLGFYIFLLSLKMDWRFALIGALAFGFGSYNLIIIVAGHITKAYTIALMAPVIGGILYTYNRNVWMGGIFTTVAVGLQIAYNHVQVTYYLALLILVLITSRFVYAILHKTIQHFIKASLVLLGAALLAVLPNITNLWTTYEYGKYSIRGKSELSNYEGAAEHSGLDKDYALAWSLEPQGSWTLLIPNAVGGASEAIANNPSALAEVEDRFKETVGGQSQYWGGRPFTSGPVYAGAVVCFLFMLGMFFYGGPDKWWLVAGTVLSLLLSWGKHFMPFTDFMFYNFPLYNKFRTVEMAMLIASFTIPTLGLLGLREVYKKPQLIREASWKFFAAFGLTGGISLLFYLFPAVFFNFISDMELSSILQQKQQAMQENAAQAGQISSYFDGIVYNLKVARATLFKMDAFRSFAFILIASASVWFFATNKLSGKYLIWGLGLLILVDHWGVDKRYLNNEHFESKRNVGREFALSESDKAINSLKQDGDRVFTIYRDPFKEVSTSYHHESIGGYHGAKLRRYQDLIDKYLMNDLQILIGTLQSQSSEQELQNSLANMSVLNMLNARFVVYSPKAAPIINHSAFGDAWFVKGIYPVDAPDGAIDALSYVPLKDKAVVNISEFDQLKDYKLDDVSGSLELKSYKPNQLLYDYSIEQEQLAVFSQIYYPKGWNAYVDGEKVAIYRTNYILRAVMLPQGEHTLEFRFEPSSYRVGQLISLISSLLILALIGWAALKLLKKK